MATPLDVFSFITSTLNSHHGHVVMEIVAARYLIFRLLDELSRKSGSDLTHLSSLVCEAFSCLARCKGISSDQIVRAEMEFRSLTEAGFVRSENNSKFREF